MLSQKFRILIGWIITFLESVNFGGYCLLREISAMLHQLNFKLSNVQFLTEVSREGSTVELPEDRIANSVMIDGHSYACDIHALENKSIQSLKSSS
jgi:hypothetical protein